MKITDLAIIALVAFMPISIMLDIEQHRQIEAVSWEQVYDEVMYNASEDATIALTQDYKKNESQFVGARSSTKDIALDLEAAIDRFYETVYINFDIEEDKVSQDSIKAYLPVQMVVDYDGLYIHTWQSVYNADMGRQETREVWMPKLPFSYYDTANNLILNFTLDDYVYVYDNATAAKHFGTRAEMAARYPVNTFISSTNFDNLRRQTIIDLIQDRLGFYTGRANYLSQVYGEGYIYNIPMVSNDTWNNTIDDISFISFLQGFPLPGTDRIYNTFGYGGSRVSLSRKYIGSTYNGVMYYHEDGCSQIVVTEAVFNSKKEAAKKGYRACPLCKP
jgi:hypothetical protein